MSRPSPEALFWMWLAFCGFCALVVWKIDTWCVHYVRFRREGCGRWTSAGRALSLTIVPMPKIEL